MKNEEFRNICFANGFSYKLYSNSDQWEVNITLKDNVDTESYQEMSLSDALDKLLGLKEK